MQPAPIAEGAGRILLQRGTFEGTATLTRGFARDRWGQCGQDVLVVRVSPKRLLASRIYGGERPLKFQTTLS